MSGWTMETDGDKCYYIWIDIAGNAVHIKLDSTSERFSDLTVGFFQH